MTHGTVRAPHVRLCGQFTAHTARAVKKNVSVGFKLHPEFYRRDTDKGTDADFDKVITDFA
jgi:hypothetical protein